MAVSALPSLAVLGCYLRPGARQLLPLPLQPVSHPSAKKASLAHGVFGNPVTVSTQGLVLSKALRRVLAGSSGETTQKLRWGVGRLREDFKGRSALDGCPAEAASPPGPGDRVQCWPLPAVARGPRLSLAELASVAGEFAF